MALFWPGEEHLDRLAPELGGVEPVEENGPAAALRVADLSGEDGGLRRLGPSELLEVVVAEVVDEHVAERVRGAREGDVAGGVVGLALRAELAAVLAHDALAADDDHVLLQLVELAHALDEGGNAHRDLGDEDDVGLPVRGAEGDVARVPAHDLDDRDAAVALRGGAHALEALDRVEDRGGVARGDVVDHAVELEAGERAAELVAVAGGLRARHPLPLVRLVAVVEAEVVVDRLRGEDHGEELGERLQAVQRPVPAHADEAVDLELLQPVGDLRDRLRVVRVHERARGADDGAAPRGVELGDLGEERVEVDVGDAGVQEGRVALDEAVDLHAPLVRPHHGAVDRRVERRRVAAGRQDADPLHGAVTLRPDDCTAARRLARRQASRRRTETSTAAETAIQATPHTIAGTPVSRARAAASLCPEWRRSTSEATSQTA